MPKNPHTSEGPEIVLGVFEEILPASVVRTLYQEVKKKYYERVLSPLMLLWGFIFQRLHADHSCDAAWSYLTSDAIQSRFGVRAEGGQSLSESTSAYCQARKRFPLAVAKQVLAHTAKVIGQKAGVEGWWHGWRVNLFDGSTLHLEASPELREHYRTSQNQHRTGHWPLMRLVVGFDFFTGAVNGVTEGSYETSEHPLAAALIKELGASWLHVGDRFLGAYRVLQTVLATHSQALVRLHANVAKRLCRDQPRPPGSDLNVIWQQMPNNKIEPDVPALDIAGRLMYVRLEKAGFRPIDLFLFTTLTDREVYPAAELVALYGLRWQVELDFRHVKTTLEMEHLDGKSVDIVRKELLLGLTTYNLLRGLMTTAALAANVLPCQLSLAKCWRRTVDACHSLPRQASPEELFQISSRLLQRLAHCTLPARKKERLEPRAVWGRPQVFPKITASRNETRQAQLALLIPPNS
jgi:DDE family transposase